MLSGCAKVEESCVNENQMVTQLQEEVTQLKKANEELTKVNQQLQESPGENPEYIKLERILLDTYFLDNGAVIEHYMTTYPHSLEQTLKAETYEMGIYVPYEKIGASELVFKGFEDPVYEEVNQQIKNDYDTYVNSYTYTDYDKTFLNNFTLCFYDFYDNDDFISILETKHNVVWSTGGTAYQFRVFNIDKTTGKLLSNEEIADDLNLLTESEIEMIEKRGYDILDANEEMELGRQYVAFNYSDPSLSAKITNESLLYKANGQWVNIVAIQFIGIGSSEGRLKVTFSD